MSDDRATIGLLGADKQAAVSAALAFPERRFLFVSDEKVLDGWDLPNVTPRAATPDGIEALRHRPATAWFPLCARWCSPAFGPVNNLGSVRLADVLKQLAVDFEEIVLPVAAAPLAGTRCIVKGDAWHRPDTSLIGDQLDPAETADPYGCGFVYQEYWPWTRHLLATGRRWGAGALATPATARPSQCSHCKREPPAISLADMASLFRCALGVFWCYEFGHALHR